MLRLLKFQKDEFFRHDFFLTSVLLFLSRQIYVLYDQFSVAKHVEITTNQCKIAITIGDQEMSVLRSKRRVRISSNKQG